MRLVNQLGKEIKEGELVGYSKDQLGKEIKKGEFVGYSKEFAWYLVHITNDGSGQIYCETFSSRFYHYFKPEYFGLKIVE